MSRAIGLFGQGLKGAVGAAALGALLAGCTEENADYCGPGKPCPEGLRCDPTVNRCVPKDGGNGDDARRRDGGEAGEDGPGTGDLGTDKPLGAACHGPAECASGFCSDDLCCEAACAGLCRSCARPGSEGTCGLVAAGADPDGDCAGDDTACGGSCDGMGACSFAAPGTPCKSPSCAAGQLTTGTCDGAGACDEQGESCGGYACADATACRTSCVSATTDCIAGFECLGNSCTNPQPDGSPCGENPKACLSDQCVDGVCCAAASCPVCQACNLNGQGSCSPVPNGTSCDPVTCSAAQKTVPACQGGACLPQTVSCAGYQCNDAGTDCRAACETHDHCVTATHFCNGSKQCQPKQALGETCGDAVECASGVCTDGVCCGVADCPHCQRCQAGSGACGAGPDGPAPAGECPGDAVCGAGVCAGGACAYVAQGTQCDSLCTGHTRVPHNCDAAHLCAADAPEDCTPYVCDDAGQYCRSRCVTGTHCVGDSACDRIYAHNSRDGVCVDLAKIITATSTSSVVDLQPIINNAVAGGKTHVKLVVAGALGFTGFTLPSGTLTVIGQPYLVGMTQHKPPIGWPGADKPAVTVSGSAALQLQGVHLTSATLGVDCTGGYLSIIESDISGNGSWGISASSSCYADVRRCTIEENWGGIAASGSLVSTNNLILNNGIYTYSAGTCLTSDGGGGLLLSGTTATVVNTTIRGNARDKGSAMPSGVLCVSLGAGSLLSNVIVQDNMCVASETVGCSFSYSNVPGIAATNGNNPSPCLDANHKAVAPCIDTGEDASDYTKLDLANTPRPKGAGYDRGAYEVQ